MVKQLGIKNLRKAFRDLSDKEKEDLVCLLYQKSASASQILDQRFMGDQASKVLLIDFNERLTKMFGKSSAFDFKKVKAFWKDSRKHLTDKSLLAEFDLCFAYHATVFTYNFGDMFEAYYNTVAQAFESAMTEAVKNSDFAKKHKRIFAEIYDMANWMAWGFGEFITDEYLQIDWDSL